MSGSFYALNSQYNSILALLAELETDKQAQDLESVLTLGNDAGGLNMTNVGAITCNTLNYTTLNPSIPEVIGNISQVLAVGNDATNQSITNLGSVAMKSGGGGSITFQDGTIQTTAFTGVAATPTLSAVITAGSNAGNQNITGLNGILSPSTLPLNLAGLNGQDINISALPAGVNPSGSVNIQTSTGVATQNWSFNDDGSFDLPASSTINYGGGSSIEEVAGELQITAGAGKTIVNGVLELDAGGGGYMIFQDGTQQTTAFTGVAATPTLSAVISAGNDAGNQSITGVNNIALTTINGTAYPPATPALSAVLTAGNDAGNQSITGVNNIALTTINGSAYPPVVPADNLTAVLTAGNNAGNNTITNLQVRDNALVGGSKSVFYNPTTGELGQTATAFPTIDLEYVLTEGNDANGLSMTGVDNIQLNTINGTAYPPATPTLSSVITAGGDAGNQSITGVNNIALTTINGSAYPPVVPADNLSAVLLAGNDAGGASIINLGSLESATNEVWFTDGVGSASWTGSGLTLLGTNLGSASGNYGVAVGLGAVGMADLATNSVAIGSNSAYQGTGVGSVAIGYQAGGGTTTSASAMGAGAVCIGRNTGAGTNNNVATGCVAVGDGAGGYGMNGSAIAIGTNAGKGTLSSVAQGSNSICLGLNAGLGYGTGGVPANSLTISSIRQNAGNTSNYLTYNTTTDEVQWAGDLAINVSNNTLLLGVNSGANLQNGSFVVGTNAGNNMGVNSFALGASAGNNAGVNQISIGASAGVSAEQSVCIGINAGNGTFNATCVGNSAGSIGLGANSVAIGTNASPTNGSADSICIVGDGQTLNPPNSGLFISPIRSAGSATNTLTYNTTTKEIQYAPIPNISTQGSNSALPVSVYNYGSVTTLTSRQNLCQISWDNTAFADSSFGNNIQIRWTLSVSTQQTFFNIWNTGQAIIQPYQLNFYGGLYGVQTANTTQANSTIYPLGLLFLQPPAVAFNNPSNYYNSPSPIGTIYFEYLPSYNGLILYCLNNEQYWANLLQPAGVKTTCQYNMNIEVLNNSGVCVSPPSNNPYTSYLAPNTAISDV